MAHRANPVRPDIAPGASVPTVTPMSAVESPSDWLVLEAIDEAVPDIRAAALVCRKLRRTLMGGYRLAGGGTEIPETVSGHTPDGKPTRRSHLAIVPLVFAGFPYADGRVFGFAVIPPSGTALLGIPGFLHAFEATAPYDPGEERRVLTLKGAPLPGSLRLAPAGTTTKRSLSPEPYLRPARVWASVTPIVLDRHLKRKGDDEIHEIVAGACENAGLPRPDPDQIQTGRHSAIEGAPSARPSAGAPPWNHWKVPESLKTRSLVHAVIDFGRETSGPVLLGAGRFTGTRPVPRRRQLIMELRPADFAAFFRAIHGHDPFPWQQALVNSLAESDEWPDVMDLPTGSGKTAALDAAVFHLALRGDSPQRAALRIVLVVDRRLVVDDAHARAEMIADLLAHPADVAGGGQAVVAEVAGRLRSLAGGGEPPLVARRLRGGVPLEHDWARTPTQPTILCSTVDQVGSRLLFRGYGVSNRMQPVHAGLLGENSLILLDEGASVRTFPASAERCARHRRGWPEIGSALRYPWRACRATVCARAGRPHLPCPERPDRSTEAHRTERCPGGACRSLRESRLPHGGSVAARGCFSSRGRCRRQPRRSGARHL